MNKIRTLAATLLAATTFAAQAQSGEAAAPTHWNFGVQFGAVDDHSRTEPAVQVSLGYQIDRTFAVEALANVSLLFIRDGEILDSGEHEFNSAIGARMLVTLPLGERWSVVGGLGVVSFSDDVGMGAFGIDSTSKTSPMVSASVMYRKSRRWSLGVEAASFTSSHATSLGLKSEFHF